MKEGWRGERQDREYEECEVWGQRGLEDVKGVHNLAKKLYFEIITIIYGRG